MLFVWTSLRTHSSMEWFHRLVTGIVAYNADVGCQLVSVNSVRLVLYRSVNEGVKGGAFHVRDALKANGAAALDGPGDPTLCCPCTLVPCPASCRL